jgi:signal transduction histidine kinase
MLQLQKQEIENAMGTLKTTQNQLIQSEKMASLGELTAGIAHEIQNPLNFVNNFSELNTELIDEFDKAMEQDNKREMSTIAIDLRQNLEKISFHGKRADSIVKSMLLHSHKTGNQMEPTDLNSMAEEYARLSYHGFRAKDKSFNTSIHSELDPAIGKINIIPQDMGRVFLNLFNNAFYAISEKTKESQDEFRPTLILQTKKLINKIEISIRDNGVGIQQKMLDKIFQPFFTTKPTGQGTGLGLSLSYDIIKAHGGEIRAISKDGEGAEFIISLPV